MDASRYVGLPYESHGRGPRAYDCWGLVRLFYQQEFGINLPTLIDGYESAAKDHAGVVAALLRERERWHKVATPVAGDVVVLRIGTAPRHVGVLLPPMQLLHSLDGHDSVIESLESPKWARRIEGFYRYAR